MVKDIAGRLNLRPHQREALEALARACSLIQFDKPADPAAASVIRGAFPEFQDFGDRDYPSLCIQTSTGSGKTRLAAACIALLHRATGIRHFAVVTPNAMTTNTLIADFTPGNPTYVFEQLPEFTNSSLQVLKDGAESESKSVVIRVLDAGAGTENCTRARLAKLDHSVILLLDSHFYFDTTLLLNELHPTLAVEITSHIQGLRNVVYAYTPEVTPLAGVAKVFTGLPTFGQTLVLSDDQVTDRRRRSLPVFHLHCLGMTAIDDGEIVLQNIKHLHVANLDKVERYRIKVNDVLLTNRSTTLRVAVAPKEVDEYYIDATVSAIRPQTSIEPFFLACLLRQSLESCARRNLVASKKANLTVSLKSLESLSIPIPPVDTQRRIVDLFNCAKAACEAALETSGVVRTLVDQTALMAVGTASDQVNRRSDVAHETLEAARRLEQAIHRRKTAEAKLNELLAELGCPIKPGPA
jgi:hypothetical protein